MDESSQDLFGRYRHFIQQKQTQQEQPKSEKINHIFQKDWLLSDKDSSIKNNLNSITKELDCSIEKFEQIKSFNYKQKWNKKIDVKKSSALPDEFIEAKESTTDNEKGVRIRLWYEAQRKFLSTIPKNVDELKQTVISLVISSKKTRLTEDDFRMYFYDYDSEKCIVETESDFESVMAMAAKATPQVLKLCIDIRRGINSVESDDENKSIRIKQDYNDRRYLEESDEEEDDEKYYLHDFELEFQSVIRDGFLYKRGVPYNKSNYVSVLWMYHWADAFTLGWTGRWENMPLMFDGEFGKMLVPHSIPPEKHRHL